MKCLNLAVGTALLAGIAANAQNPPAKAPVVVQHDVIKMSGPNAVGFVFERQVIGVGGGERVEFVSAEASVSGKTVKGAPYSAEIVNERTQTLADGNKIVDKSTSATYRDGEGRTRREISLPSGDHKVVIINDPVANVSYHLDTKLKTARKMPVAPFNFSMVPDAQAGIRVPAPFPAPEAGAQLRREAVAVVRMEQASGAPGQLRMRQPDGKTETLPGQVIEGLQVEGTRTVTTIPAGEIGNERAIEIVHERWYSPELQALILTRHSDPRLGDTVYKIANIKRGEPHPSLFQVPPDYTLEEGPVGPGVRIMRRDGPDHKE
jgi:hypothetical protein